MSARTVSAAVDRRLGPGTLARLRSLRRRLWWRRAVRAGMLAIAATVLGVALVQLLAVGLGAMAWAIRSIRSRPSLVEAARRADEELALRQRLGTALELAGRQTDDPLEARQLADARARLNAVDLRRAFRPHLARRPLAVVGVGLAMTLLLVAWPNPQDDVVEQRRAAREAAERVAERVEDVADEVGEENVENPDPRREELERQLRELARQLREQGADREATLARIGSVQEELSRMADPQAANDLEELAERADSLDREEAQARAAELRQAAQAGAASQPQVARALAEAADALDSAARSGSQEDQRAAAEALERAADAFRQSERDRQLQRDVSRAQSALQDGARQVARAGQPAANNTGQPGGSGQP